MNISYITLIFDFLEVLVLLVSVLFSVAYLTVAERKTLAYCQRRLGPNAVGFYNFIIKI